MTAFQTSFRFNEVVIIDALSPSEYPQTAVWLRDHILKPLTEESTLHLTYRPVADRSALFSVLAEVLRATRDYGHYPILHFEAHGTEAGLVVAGRDVVAWSDLKPALVEINHASRMNLLAVMSMCHGWHLIKELQPIEAAPVWAWIGPVPEVPPARLQEAFQAFYPTLLRALDGRRAFDEMNSSRMGTDLELKMETAELTFCRIWRGYEKEHCSPEVQQAREDRLVEHFVRRSGYDLRFAIQGRPLAREWLADTEKSFYHFHRIFTMLEEFPENASRFGLTYGQCVGERPNTDLKPSAASDMLSGRGSRRTPGAQKAAS